MEEEEKKHEGFPLQDSRVLECDVTTVFVLFFFLMEKKWSVGNLKGENLVLFQCQ